MKLAFYPHLRCLLVVLAAVGVGLGPASAETTLMPISDVALLSGSPLHIPLNGFDGEGDPLAFIATVTPIDGDAVVEAFIPTGNRSMRITVPGYGEMVLELFEQRAPRPTSRIIELADSGFYDGLTFHRIIDGFMMQGGCPLGTGTGGSGVWFDDQFHVELQHNRAGVLSMAKSSNDDTNDSQFFITDAPTRWLDGNHSIFGQLTVGDDVRDTITNLGVGGVTPPGITMSSVEIFTDAANAVLMLSADSGSGTASVTVTASDGNGNTAEQTFGVTIQPDTTNTPPWLADLPATVTTPTGVPIEIQLEAIDVEGDPPWFDALVFDSPGSTDLQLTVDKPTGLVTLTPINGMVGEYGVLIGVTADGFTDWDMQVINLTVTEPAAVPGDIDGDGDVDLEDFVILKKNFNTTSGATRDQGDLDADGDVDLDDFVIFKKNFGT